MARRLRFIPEGGALVEVTSRTVQGRFLLRPSRRLNQIVLGVLGRAQRKHAIALVGYVFLSNHYHLLLWAPDAQALASFMNFFNGNLAKEAGRLANWREKFWGRRYQAIVVSEEPAAQIARLQYLLSHGVKEGLVRRPKDWRGVHAAQHILDRNPREGIWVNRTKACNARMRGREHPGEELESVEIVTLSPLPCWSRLERRIYRERLAELIAAIERIGRTHQSEPRLPRSPHERPLWSKRSPAPYFHCISPIVRRGLLDAYRWFVAAYREATARLNRGDPMPAFPAGSFPPSPPYVAHA